MMRHLSLAHLAIAWLTSPHLTSPWLCVPLCLSLRAFGLRASRMLGCTSFLRCWWLLTCQALLACMPPPTCLPRPNLLVGLAWCVCVRLRVCRCFVAWPCLPAAVVACHAHACWLASLCCWWLVLGAWCLAWRCLVALSALLICLPLPLCSSSSLLLLSLGHVSALHPVALCASEALACRIGIGLLMC